MTNILWEGFDRASFTIVTHLYYVTPDDVDIMNAILYKIVYPPKRQKDRHLIRHGMFIPSPKRHSDNVC
jgi:hypothetical protein